MHSIFSGFYRALLPALLLAFGSVSAQAQPAPLAPVIQPAPQASIPSAPAIPSPRLFAGIILNEGIESAPLANNFYIIPDAEKNLSVRLITEKIVTGAFAGNTAKSPVINLGLEGKTTWLVFPLTNVSSSDVWELDFGDSSSGRQTFLDRISIYNSFSRKTVFESNPQGAPGYSISSKIRLSIPVGQTGFIIIETRNPAGSLSMLNLSLKPAYFTNTSRAITKVITARIPLIVAVILLSAMLLRRQFAFGALGLAWLLIYLHHYMIDNYIFISGISPDILTPGIWLLVSLLLITGFWLTGDEDYEFPPSIFIGLGFLSFVLGLISLLIAEFMPVMGSILGYGPLFIANLVLLGMGYMVASRHDRSFIFLSLSGLLLIAAMVSISAASLLLGQTPEILLSGSHLILCLAAISIAAFALLRQSENLPMASTLREAEVAAATPQNKDLASAKENSEHKRLLQVLDQERAMMAEMQVQEARRTEEMRKAKEAADEANNAKSAFLAVVSHEIRTPMTGIMGMVRLMLDTALSKDQKEYASTIQDSGEALMALLNDILDFEKIESGKLELERTDFDLHRLLRGVQTLMNGHANSKGVELRLELDPRLPPYVVGDPTRLRQILLNLVNNAIKFTSKGAVYLRINDLTPDDKLDGPHQIYFAVQDSGIGISPDVQKKLFMPFAQADSSTSRKYGGTGLGLAICKRLIEVMGGAINISSKPGEGATFFFTLSLPLGQAAGVSGSFAGAASGSGPVDSMPLNKAETRHLHILVVDDNGINQKVLSGLIEKDGHTVVTASTGAEALGKYLASTYDLVLMDLELPDRNGIEVTSDIRNLRETDKASVPIVAMTGNTSEKDIAACFNAGMDDFLAKPINPDRLKTILKIAGGNGSFANHVQKQVRTQNAQPAVTVIPDVSTIDANTYVPVPPPAPNTPFTKPEGPPPAALPEVPAFSFDLGDADEDEDTFASAIRQFETIEARKENALDSDLDENMLSTLKNSLTVAQLEELLVSFYEKAEELVTAIGQAYLEKDLEALGARAHELKGMAGNFGFTGVSTLSGQIEKAAKTKNEPDLTTPVQRLAETYAVSKARLVTWLAE